MSGILRTVGQITIGAAAFALGGPLAFAGVNLAFGILFPPKQNTAQAKPQNLDLNLSDPDGPMPCFWGTVGGVGGNYVTVAKDKDGKPSGVLTVKKTKSEGGKGGKGSQKVTTYKYYLIAEMAIGYAGDGGPLFVDKLEWVDGDGTTVLWDRFAEDDDKRGMTLTPEYSDNGTLISESGKSSKGDIVFYLGTEEQQPCAFLEQYWGVGELSPHRGIAKIGFNRVEMSGGQPTIKTTVRCATTHRRDIIVQRFQQVRIPKSRMRIDQVRGDVLGAAVSGKQPARQLCEQLASRVFTAFAFNNGRIEDFYKLNVKKWTLDETELGAHEIDGQSETPGRVKLTLKGEDDFYSQVEATFLDVDNSYEENTGTATRHDSKNSNPNSVSIPEVARMADIVPWCQSSLDEDSVSDHTLAISLLPGRCNLALGNVLTVPIRKSDNTTEPRDYLISELQLQPSGIIDITGTPYSSLVYVQGAVNNPGAPGDGVRALTAPIPFVAQPPALSDEQLGNIMLDDPGVLVAATVDDGEWGNGVVFDFNNNGKNLTSLAFPATMGYITEDFDLGQLYDYDTTRTLDITMYGDGVLQTADIADVRAGANILLFETGRVISFTTATQTGLRDYQISGIKDGRFGSDVVTSYATVSGAGTSSYDGIYIKTGYYNNKPYYLAPGKGYLFYNTRGTDGWWINDVLGGTSASYYKNGNTLLPPSSGWVRGDASNPAPTFALTSATPSGTKVLLLHNHEGNMEGSVVWVKSTFSSLNKNITSAFFPSGRDEAALTSTEQYNFTAENLRDPAPVAVKLVRGGDGSATLTGRLRTRIMDDGSWNTSSPGTMTDANQGKYGISVNFSDGIKIIRKDFTSTDVEFSIAVGASTLASMFGTLPTTLSGDVFMINSLVGDGRPRAFTEE